MRDFLAFALLPRREDHSTPRFVQQHGAAFLTVEMVGPNLLTIDERKDQAIREKRPDSSIRSSANPAAPDDRRAKKPTLGSSPAPAHPAVQSASSKP